ncbi:MAG: YbaN family protein [Burkholderiaceae bacterium]
MASSQRPAWQRALWLAAGVASLVLGVIGIVLPVMPTVPFVLFAAFCFSRGSARLERWLLEHPRLGPPIRAWREHRAVSRRAKQFAVVMMTISSLLAWWLLPPPWRWLPAGACAVVATWLLSLPTTAPHRA